MAGTDRCSRISEAFHANLAPLVAVLGVLGLIHDSWPTPLSHRGNLHVLFGSLLWLCVVARFYRWFRLQPRLLIDDIRPFCRHLSRLVYLLLYLLMCCQLIIGILSDAPHRSVQQINEGFQAYLACGVLALLTIQVLAALSRYWVMHAAGGPLHLIQRNGRLT
jgi:cytochrome b561